MNKFIKQLCCLLESSPFCVLIMEFNNDDGRTNQCAPAKLLHQINIVPLSSLRPELYINHKLQVQEWKLYRAHISQ